MKPRVLLDSCVFVDAFDKRSANHQSALTLLQKLYEADIVILMPSHAWFEVECALKKLTEDGRYCAPVFDGKREYPVELIHIDRDFLKNYSMTPVPYIKAGDHIFIAVALKNNYILISSDTKVHNVGKKCGVVVASPEQYIFDHLS
jgi:predicted nucleic acid-binding protein